MKIKNIKDHPIAWIALLVALLIFVSLSLLQPSYAGTTIKNRLSLWLNITGSYPRGFYRNIDKKIGRGDYVVFCLPFSQTVEGLAQGYLEPGICENGAKPLIKQVFAKENDSVQIQEHAVQVNEKYYLGLKPLSADSKGSTLNAKFGRYLTAKDQLWVFSDYIENSWDSRYFGPIDKSAVISVVEPIWLFE